jgi:hypothetical protein
MCSSHTAIRADNILSIQGQATGRKEHETTPHTPVGQYMTTSTRDHGQKPAKNVNAHWQRPPKDLATQNKRDMTPQSKRRTYVTYWNWN